MSKPILQIVIASTRPGRVGLPVAQWFDSVARDQGAFDVELVDLAEVDLPLLDEPAHPRPGSTSTRTPSPGVRRWTGPTPSCS